MVAGCSSPATTTTTSPPTTAAPSPASTTLAVTVDSSFPRTDIVLDGVIHRVAVADTDERRSRGLMGVTDLGDLYGMMFVFDEPRQVSFWMKDTLIPLDIAFFDESGRLIGVTTMLPCEQDPCPSYPSGGAASWALETPAGVLADLGEGARLVVP